LLLNILINPSRAFAFAASNAVLPVHVIIVVFAITVAGFAHSVAAYMAMAATVTTTISLVMRSNGHHSPLSGAGGISMKWVGFGIGV
jgi:hypothetical protein